MQRPYDHCSAAASVRQDNAPVSAPLGCDAARFLARRLRDRSAVARCVAPLDYGHISGRVVGVAGPGGVGLRRCSIGGGAQVGGGMRGSVRGFSADSRRRMMRRVTRVDWSECPAYFVGLTYPDVFPADPAVWKADLKAWRKRICRRLRGAFKGALWKLEVKPRLSGESAGFMAPHFHVVLLLSVDVPESEVYRVVAGAWHDRVAPGDVAHLVHGCNVQRVYNIGGHLVDRLMAYLCKYMAKEVQAEDIETGRCWGIWGSLPWVWVGFHMSHGDYVTFCRRVRCWRKASAYCSRLTSRWRGCLIFGDGYAILDIMRGLDSLQIGPAPMLRVACT